MAAAASLARRAAVATLARRPAAASQLPRGGARPFSSFINYAAKINSPHPTSTTVRHLFPPKRLLHDAAKEEMEALKARVQRLEQETTGKFVETDGKVFRLEVIATDQSGKILSLKELQARHGDLLAALVRNAISEARVSTDRYGMVHAFHTEVLLRMGTLSFKVVMSCIAAATTAGFAVIQILNSNNLVNTEKRVDKAVAQRTAHLEEKFVTGLGQTVKEAVQVALAKKFVEDQNNKPLGGQGNTPPAGGGSTSNPPGGGGSTSNPPGGLGSTSNPPGGGGSNPPAP